MTLPFAVLGALVAAVLEATVLPELPIGGTHADLVLAVAVVATMLLGAEDGFAAAFAGGLMLDMLIAARPLGAATFALLIVVGFAALAARVVGSGHRLPAIVAVFALTFVFHGVLFAVLVLTQGFTLITFEPRLVLVAAGQNAVAALPLAVLLAALDRRLAPERAEWG